MNIALVLAAGLGKRMDGAHKPKQFLSIKNKPLFLYSVEAFQNNKDISKIVIVTNKEYVEKVKSSCEEYKLDKVVFVMEGGSSRQESSYLGLKKIASFASEDDIVLIHDAARPLVSQRIIDDNIKMANIYFATDTVFKAIDTIVEARDGEKITSIPNREYLYQSQTPQSFKLGLILKAHEMAISKGNLSSTDDARLVLNMGQDVYLVNGDPLNFKVTTKIDLDILENILKSK